MAFQGIIFSDIRHVVLIYEGVFLMGAFCAAVKIRPRLHPKKGDCLDYQGLPGGARIEVRYVSAASRRDLHLTDEGIYVILSPETSNPR
jgi:hypothetical protein